MTMYLADENGKLLTDENGNFIRGTFMAADLQPTIDIMTAADTVMDSAAALIGSFPGLIKTAVDAAIAGGATAAQLQPVTDLGVAMKAKSDALLAAVAANTPSPPPTPAQNKVAAGK